MIEAERKPAPLDDRTIVAVEDQGKLIDLGNTKVLLDSFFDRGIHNLLVTPGEPIGTHWWLLRMKSGLRLAYIGTAESFARLAGERGAGPTQGEAHLFEFGRNGKLI
jgi:hypothetical protein